jgi:hypothetical protein
VLKLSDKAGGVHAVNEVLVRGSRGHVLHDKRHWTICVRWHVRMLKIAEVRWSQRPCIGTLLAWTTGRSGRRRGICFHVNLRRIRRRRLPRRGAPLTRPRHQGSWQGHSKLGWGHHGNRQADFGPQRSRTA